ISTTTTTLHNFIKITGNRLVSPSTSVINAISNPCPTSSINLSNSLTSAQQANIIAYEWQIANAASPSTIIYTSSAGSPGTVNPPAVIGSAWTPGATYQVRLRLQEQC